MRAEKLKLIFERYRSDGDVRSLALVFDTVAPELLQVARHLEGRGGEAEDLVQTTFLIAIQRAHTYDISRPLVPWLLGILVNQAHLARRRRGRLVAMEEENQLEGAQPQDAPQESEFLQALGLALSELPETYREVLVAHLREGKKPGEIATELGRPPGTVRAQLHRGLRLLRRSLPESFALGWLAALLVPASLASARESVLRSAREQAGPRVPPGKLVPSPRWLRAAALTAVAGLGWWLWESRADPRPAPELAAHPGDAQELAAPPELEAPASATSARTRAANTAFVASTGAAQRGDLLLRVLHADDERPAIGVEVTLLPWAEEAWYAHVIHVRTNAEGQALIRDLAPGHVGVHLDGGAQTRIPIEGGKQNKFDLHLARGVRLHGRVLGANGAPARGAQVELFARSLDLGARSVQACAEDGSFELLEADLAHWIAASAPGAAPSERVALERYTLPGAREQELVLELGPAREPLELRVRDESGAALPGVTIEVQAPIGQARPGWRAGGELATDFRRVEAHTDAGGRAWLDTLPDEELRLVVRATGRATHVATLELRQAGTLEIELAREARVQGRIVTRGPDGALVPAAGASVALEGSEAELQVETDAAGRFALGALPAGELRLVARAAGSGPPHVESLVLRAGEARAWDAVIEPESTLEGCVIGSDGRPTQIWLVRAIPLDAPEALVDPLARRLEDNHDQALLSCWTQAQGRFRVPCSGAGPFRVELFGRGNWQRSAVAWWAPIEAGTHDLRLEVKASYPGGSGTLLLPLQDGGAFAEVFALSPEFGGVLRAAVDPGTGRFKFQAMADGAWQVYARKSQGPLRLVGARQLAVRGSRDLGVLEYASGTDVISPRERR